MPKIALKLTFIFLALWIILVIVVFNGVKIDTLSLNDIKIKQLYLKYDKKLILNFKLEAEDTNISIGAILIPTFKTYGTIATIEELKLKYHNDLEKLISHSGYVELDNGTINLHLNSAISSKTKIFNTDILIGSDDLKIKLHSKSLIDKSLIDILSAYDIDLDLEQIKGKNKIYVYLNIPFNEDPTKADLKIDIKDSVINVLNTDSNSSDINVSNLDFPLVKLTLDNTIIDYDTAKMQVNDFKLTAYDENIILNADINKSKIILNKKDLNISLSVLNLQPSLVNILAQKDIIKDGNLTLNINGNIDNLNGKVTFNHNTITNVTIINNLISFINSTPAIINPLLALPTLFRMGETNFDLTGYYVRDGYIDFSYDRKKEYLKLNDIYTHSKMMDFRARGFVDLKDRKLHTNIDVIFMKDHSKFLNHIPVVGYLVTGKDGNFITQVDVYGSLDNPEFETHTVKNASDGIINALKRVITLPLMPFEDLNTSKENLKQHKDVIDSIINQ